MAKLYPNYLLLLVAIGFMGCKATKVSPKNAEPKFASIAAYTDNEAKAATTITGTVSNFTNEMNGTVTSYDIITRKSTAIGSIDQTGHLSIPLKNDYLEDILGAMEKEEKPDGWAIRLNTLGDTFACNENTLTYNAIETTLTGFPDFNVTDEKGKNIGVLYAASSPSIARWLYSYGSENAVEGFYLQWYYSAGDASVNGLCSIPTYTGIMDENYLATTALQITLKKGWNLILHEITTVFKDANGKITPKDTRVTTIPEIPIQTQWFVISDL